MIVSAVAPGTGRDIDEALQPQSYPLSLRNRGYEIWKPLVGILLLASGMFLVAPFLMLPVLAIGVAVDHTGSFATAFENAATLDTVTWQGMLYLNLSLAALVPISWLIVRFVHQQSPRTLASVRPGFRWRFFWACFGLAVVAVGAQILLAALLPGDPGELDGSFNDWTQRLTALAIVIVLTTPLQAIGEEYGFRGYLLQAFGSLSRRPWIGIVLSALLFACAHGVQNAPLFLDRFTFGLMAGYVVYRTGGLEAGIAMHVWNNLVAFGFALLIGNIDDVLTITEVSWWNIPLTIVQNGVYLLLVLWLARRMKVRSTTDPLGSLPAPPPGSTPVLLPTTPPV